MIEELNWALSTGEQSTVNNTIAKNDILQGQRSKLDNLVLDEHNRYNPDIIKEFIDNTPNLKNTTGKLAEELLAPPTPQSLINMIPEDLLIEDMQVRLRRLRDG
ncbi:hypothetical protein BC89_08110 [Pseudomonas monteilii]|nr:hypothetical protein BC89_08110 [Pseudomonas monteilii]